MPHALGGCRLKLERAVAHIGTLNKAIQRFRESQGYELVSYDDLETGEISWWVTGVNKDPPPTPGVPCLATSSTTSTRLSIISRGSWPFARTTGMTFRPRSGLNSRSSRIVHASGESVRDGRWTGLSGASSLLRFPGDARKLVLAVQPYKDGQRSPEHPLWILHALSNEDKHQTLRVVWSSHVDSKLHIDELTDTRLDQFTPISGRIRGPTKLGELKLDIDRP